MRSPHPSQMLPPEYSPRQRHGAALGRLRSIIRARMTDVQATLFMSVLLSRLNAPILECTCDSALCWEIAQRISAESTGHAEVYFAYCRGTGATVRRIASTRSVRKSGAATGTAVWCVTARHFRPVFPGSYASPVASASAPNYHPRKARRTGRRASFCRVKQWPRAHLREPWVIEKQAYSILPRK